MKKMVFYAAGVLLTGYMAVIYRSQILSGLMAAEILILFPTILPAVFLSRKLLAGLSAQTPVVERGQKGSVLLVVENPTLFPAFRAEAEIVYWNQFRKKKHSAWVQIQISGKGREEILCEWRGEHCGNLIFQVRRIKIWDYLRITSFRRACGETCTASILPVPRVLSLPPADREKIPEEGETYDPHRGGDDPSEIFQVREFRPGDRVSGIHWKLSARSGTLMTKEYSRPLQEGGLLFLDLYSPEASGNWAEADDYLDLVFSFCLALLEEERNCRVVWRTEEQGLSKMELKDQESVYELLGFLFRTVPYGTKTDLEEEYREQFPSDRPAFLYRLDLQCRLWEGGKLLWESGKKEPAG